MVRTSVLHDALNSINNAEKAGKRQVLIRPASKVIVKFLQVMQKHGYIGEFTQVDDHRSGKIVVELNGRLNKCGVISPRYNVRLNELEKWVVKLLPARQFGYVILTTSAGIMDQEEARRKHQPSSSSSTHKHHTPIEPPASIPISSSGKTKPAPKASHPIWHLTTQAEREFEQTKARQSKTLRDAVAEYRRRYGGLAPPPNFDKWWAYAQSKGVVLVDEFDSIYDLLLPFWGLQPATVRARAKEALGFDNALMGVAIRDGNVTYAAGGPEWQPAATKKMLAGFVEWLPDMDLAFNVHDEPRVVVPHDDMARLVQTAKGTTMARAAGVARPKNQFSKTKGLNDGRGFEPTKLTRFNFFAHQPTWTHSRVSCPPDSPARVLEEDQMADDISQFGLGELGFVYNDTAMSDICLSPSLRESYGFFDRPNAYNIVHDLFPIFSQSKISSYADIIYPSPWYYADRVKYDSGADQKWDDKADKLYWRGSTTGGYSRNGGWRRQHRQRFVAKLHSVEQARVLENEGNEYNQKWAVREVPRGEFRDMMDVYFSHVGQCDQPDCDAQREFFDVKAAAPMETAYKYKHVLDLDGNAFSGRFYALLQSRSLVYKFAVFREWHHEWIRPWAHYVPLSLQGEDWLEAVRFFSREELGRKEAERVAMQSKEWAEKVLRHEDMEVWFFRLLLEYGRVIDDDRENIGYVG
ncbi:hypothetical protein QBC47DRAFT_425223 [Echria macrotheca]|uniref:Glycosyl transferase CAP10 domain-containing protein n=1 Tax=Echria macrotheca TaxID=438768 RepID=A0AAJ0F1T2_9PEZI|nr:hypothetical protein QBC47DRAFT_425223 [Echria macrotheca]